MEICNLVKLVFIFQDKRDNSRFKRLWKRPSKEGSYARTLGVTQETMDIIQRGKFLRKWEDMGFTEQIKRFSMIEKAFYLVTVGEKEIMSVKFGIFRYDSLLE